MGLAAPPPELADSLFPPHCTVVLLAGVPGDLESETTYRAQVKSWLELSEKSAQIEKLFVLCDEPDTVTLSSSIRGKVLKGDRPNFLGLSELAKAANSLTVIAWGHGGKQGSDPVFHVRGPRLTPTDFRTVANSFNTLDSRWLLFFRGSGAFGSQLAGEHRQILASERDTMFASDPISMALLLKLAREQPASPFERLANQLGRATTSWYEERHLARTEDPTLWAGKQEPVLLASASEENPPKNAASSPEPAAAHAPDNTDSNAPPAWGVIKSVEGKLYPDCEAIRLSRRVSFTLGADPAITSEQEEFIQVLNREGQHFGDFDVSYAPPMEELNFLSCEVRRPDGKVIALDPDGIREAQQPALGDYQVGRRKFFSLPGVTPGAILHVNYRTQWKKFPLPYVSLEIPIQLELPALESVIEVSVPKDAPFHFLLDFADDPDHASEPATTHHTSRITHQDPELKQTTYGTTYRWRFQNLPARRRDSLVSPGRTPRLQFSTFPDWKAFAEWYSRVTQLTDEVTPELASKAEDLTHDAKTAREKIMALYNYVSSLRYVAIPLGVNSFRPHSAGNVLHNQFGDCKDKANLFNTLLHALHFDAQLVLVPRFTQAHQSLPGLAFNHAISRVILDKDPLWVDTTDEVCRFGMLPPGDPGRRVLIMDGKSTNLVELPQGHANEHSFKLQGEVRCEPNTDSLPITLRASALGYPDYQLRHAMREMKEHGLSVPLLAANYKPAAGSFALRKQSATPVSALDENFSWQAEGSCIGVCSLGADRWTLRCPFWLPKEWDAALHDRSAPLFLNQGYPLKLEQEFTFRLPHTSKAAALASVAENQTEPLRWRIEWATVGDDKLAARFHAELAHGELSESETAQFQQQLRKLLAALAAPTLCEAPK